jgi:1-aminocyclopropane-1-carboxylate deaminase/D-cysteine desulfhydrase-like pyridoxal-dependent ACC family enzyme
VYDDLISRVTARGARPYVLPPGGSTGIGIAGFVAAVAEVHRQLGDDAVRIDTLVFPTGTGGTQAGLLLGADLLGWPLAVVGISTGKTAAEMRPAILAMIDETAAALGVTHGVTAEQVIVDDGFYGAGYAKPDTTDYDAADALARHDGLLCDPVYNARAIKGLIALADRGALPGTGDLLYWHTGGAPALFAFDAPR